MVSWMKRHSLVAYFAIAYAITWTIEIPLAASSRGWIAWQPPFGIHYLAAYGPMLAAIIVTSLIAGAGGLKELLGRVLNWREGVLWWLVALSPLLAYMAVTIVLRLVQGTWTDFSLLGEVNFLPRLSIGAAALLWLFTFGLGEEVGWRGFALPRLQAKRSALLASLILWPLWALWHWPMFLYVYDAAMLPMILLGMLTGTVFLTWLYNSTGGSVLIVTVWHGMYNTVTASKAGEGTVAIIVTTAVMVWAVVVVVWFKPANLSHRDKQVIEAV